MAPLRPLEEVGQPSLNRAADCGPLERREGIYKIKVETDKGLRALCSCCFDAPAQVDQEIRSAWERDSALPVFQEEPL